MNYAVLKQMIEKVGSFTLAEVQSFSAEINTLYNAAKDLIEKKEAKRRPVANADETTATSTNE